MKYTIAFDMDNTICTSIRRNHQEDIPKVKPRENMIKLIRGLKKKEHKITIFTRRGASGKNARKLTEEWLKKYDIPYDELIIEKPHYDLLIDDRAISCHRNFWTPEFIEIEAEFCKEDINKHTYNPRCKK